MDTRKLSVGVFSLVLLAGAGAWAFAQPTGQPPAKASEKAGEESDEEVIDFAKAPEAVRTAALKLVGAGGEKSITKVTKEEDEEDVYTYEVEYTSGGINCAGVFSSAGDLMELEKSVTEPSLPAAALAALKKEYPKAAFADPNAVQKFYYEIDVVIDGKSHEIKVDAAGNIKDKKGGEHGDKDGDKQGGHKGEKHDEKD